MDRLITNIKRRKKAWRLSRLFHSLFISSMLVMSFVISVSCSSIDCPLNHLVQTTYKFAGNVTVLHDTLSISTTLVSGVDPVNIKRVVNVDSVKVQMSYRQPEDILFFHIKKQDGTSTLDTVIVKKDDYIHFESVDCNPSFFHTITGIEYTHHRIDSIVINQSNVTYDASKPHFYIYFKDTDNHPIATY